MEQHAVPRQITTFEFKLIGFLTLKQFLYMVVAAGIAVLVYFLTPIPIVNIISATLVFGVGAFFAYFKYNERSLDIWAKNLITRLISPSQYLYIKRNYPPSFLNDVFIQADSATTSTHMEAKQKLSSYVASQGSTSKNTDKQKVNELLSTGNGAAIQSQPAAKAESNTVVASEPTELQTVASPTQAKAPSLAGVVRNRKELPLPNIMVYIKDTSGKIVRILKTNQKGVFATFHPLLEGEYDVDIKDLGGRYFFDNMKLSVPMMANAPLSVYSKEVL